MKKTLALILTLILTLAMTTSTFAADTAVTFTTENSQISVTVPATLPATVDWETGVISFAENYAITNGSVFPIEVTSITCVAESGWTLAETGGILPDVIVATIDPNSAGAIPLLETTYTDNNTDEAWSMRAKGAADGDDTLAITFAGSIENAGAMTAALGTDEATAATAFTITFTVASGSNLPG